MKATANGAQTAFQAEALRRAQSGNSVRNDIAVIEAFADRGLADIRPRVNVFTYAAWKALGRQVRRGESGVKITTWIPIDAKTDDSGAVIRPGGVRPKTAHVFHVTQTDLIG